MGVSLIMCLASTEISNGEMLGVTAVFLQVVAKVTPKCSAFAKESPQEIIQVLESKLEPPIRYTPPQARSAHLSPQLASLLSGPGAPHDSWEDWTTLGKSILAEDPLERILRK